MAFGFRNSSDSIRQYYSTALERSIDQQQEFWTDQPQRPLYPASQQLGNTLKFATVAGAIAAAGYIPTGKGKHVWDYYLSGLRGIEEYSPGKILRTFQASSIFSPFGSQVRFANKFISPELLTQNAGYAEYLSTLIGEKVGSHTYSRLVSEGVTLKEGRLFWGQTSETALKYASAIAVSPEGGAATIGAAYARRLGVAEGHLKFPDFFKTVKLFGGATNPTLDSGDVFQVIGGHSRAQDIGRKLGAYGTEGIGRFNRLLDVSSRTSAFRFLTAPLRKLGFNPSLAVKSAGGLEMLGRLSAKYGLGLGALALGYETADWAVRQSSLFDNTLFEEGITYGAATLGVKTHIGAAKLAEATGLQSYQAKQEKIAPGSTSLQKLLAFPLMGFLGAETAFYGYRVARMAKGQIFDKLNVTMASKTADEAVKSWANLGSHFDRLGKLLTSQGGLYGRQDWVGRAWRGISRPDQQGELLFKGLGRLTPQKFVGIVGAGLGVAAVLPFLPGALIPSESPEELRRIYSGEQEVPIRRGRWWEMGRCNSAESLIKVDFTSFKKAEDIQIKDSLIASDGTICKVKNIYQRQYKDLIYKIATRFDPNLATELTGNHRVPVLREEWVYDPFDQVTHYKKKEDRKPFEVEAKDIRIGDFVQIPVLPYKVSSDSLNCLDYLTQFPLFVQDDKIYSAQTNWFTRKLQKSGYHSVPTKLALDSDLGYLFGIFLAEGNISFTKGIPHLIETVHSIHEQEIIDKIFRVLKEKFGIIATCRYKKDGPKSKEGCYVIRICSSILAKLFYGLFYKVPYKAEDKLIPTTFYSASEDFKLGLINGYHGGDGHREGNRLYITSARKWLLDSIGNILLSLGFFPSQHKAEQCHIKQDGTYATKYRIGWTPEDRYALSIESFQRIGDRVYTRVVSINREEYEGLVYDFEIDHPDHLLQAGAFLVHNSAYEGENIMYFRPHAYALMKARPAEKGIWGSDADELSPLARWEKEQFSYELEQRHYRDRPYPVTALPFQDVPFIGPILSATIGSWIKPPAYMHTEEWQRGQAIKAQPLGFGQRVATEIGQTPGGIPVSATDPTQALGEEIYRVGTEVPGLVGFLGSAIKEKVTGTGDWFDQYSQLESAGRMTSYEREYWDKELGGLAGTSEVWRRLYPHRRRQIDLYNPIENDMPSWMPGPGGRSPDFRHGDPFTKIEMGEARLPGPGYAALHPELEGINPEDYPILEKFKILADVAPYSEEFMSIAAQTRRARKSSDWTQENEADFQETLRQFKAVREKKKFENYQYLSPMGDIFSSEGSGAGQSSSVMAAINEQRKSGQEKPGLFKRLFGGYWELLAHNAETAFDQLTPISPGAKLVHMRTPIESYEREILYGSSAAFWQHPVRDFISPFVRSIGKTLGITEPSGDIQSQRAIESYFDILKYVKYTRLSNLARMSGDTSATKEFEQRKDETLFGVNPFTRNYSSIFRALPRRERDYFTAFEQAGSEEERQTILDMVPENEKALYIARWKLVHADEINRAKKAGILNEKQVQEADIELAGIQREASAEGFETSKSLFAEYLKTRLDGETYPDWYRRTKILANMQSIPGPDWVGFDPSVNLEDIKLKIIQNLGENPIDFNIWPSQSKQLPYKSYIDEEAIEPIVNAEQLSQGEMKDRLQTLLSASDMKGDVFISSHDNLGLSEGIEFDIEEDKEIEYREAIRNAL